MTTEIGAWLPGMPLNSPNLGMGARTPKKKNEKNFELKAEAKSKSSCPLPPAPYLPPPSPLPRPSAITYKYKIVPAYAQLHSGKECGKGGTQNDIWALISHPLARLGSRVRVPELKFGPQMHTKISLRMGARHIAGTPQLI